MTPPLRLVALVALAALVLAAPAAVATAAPTVVRDVKTGFDPLGTVDLNTDAANFVQPDTQTEPSIAVNPQDPLNAVAGFQEGRIDNGGDATNGYAATFDGGSTWQHGELPGLTTFAGQGGQFERASDAVMAFGPDNTVYASSLVFDQNTGNGLRSGMAVNVSHNGGRTWSPPVIFQDDRLGGLNDKNWVVVDNSAAPGHHKGRVYVVWDRVVPVVYDYCDANCEQASNWLPNVQTLPGLVFAGQGIGAIPLILKGGGLGIALQTTTAGIPAGSQDELEPTKGNHQVFITAPAAGSTPYPAPLVFAPPVQIASNDSNGVPAQRASDGLAAAAVDPKSGALYVAWDDGRFRSDGTNDIVVSRSTDDGVHWASPTRVNGGPKDDHVDHYNAMVAVGDDGAVHVAWRQRVETGTTPNFPAVIDTYYRESHDGGTTWSDPLKVDSIASNAYYDAKSRDGSFEGDYSQVASAQGRTYVVRAQGQPAFPGEPPALTDAGDGKTLALTGRDHTHQSVWVALVENATAQGPGDGAGPDGVTVTTPSSGPQEVAVVGAAIGSSTRACRATSRVAIHLPKRARSATIFVNGHHVGTLRSRALRARLDLTRLKRGRRVTVRIRVTLPHGRTKTIVRHLVAC